MNEEQYKALVAQLGKDAADEIARKWAGAEQKMREISTEAIKQGGITKERFEEYEAAGKLALEEVKEICRKQGLSLEEITRNMATGGSSIKSIAEVLKENEDAIKNVYMQGSGTSTFMLTPKADGTFAMRPFKTTDKTTGAVATIDGIPSGATSSISQSLAASSILRMGGNAQIFGQYRNTQWLFDLVNVVNAGWDMPFAVWFEESAVQGGADEVLEGAPKPLTQYSYVLKSQAYKKVAQLVTFTEEFSLDFPRLQSDIMGKGRTDVLNKLNSVLLTDVIAAATAYNSAASFTNSGADPVPTPNDFDVIAAMAAQSDNATFGGIANSAIMSTFKKYRMGVLKSTQLEYLNRPDVLDNLSFIGNPGMGADDVIVGDMKQVNLILRGGFLVKVGYNGTDFAENKFSVVMEQFYYDWIPTVRRTAIVKGTTFATVKAAIG